MNVYVCLKQVPNVEGVPLERPEEGFSRARAWFLNPHDRHALSEALKASTAMGCPCVVVSAGGPEAEESLRQALALGAERALFISPFPTLAGPELTARCLAAAIRRDADGRAPRLIFCGKQAADLAEMQVPYRLAALLNCAVLSDVVSWTLEENAVRITRQSGGTRQRYAAHFPCVLALDNAPDDLSRPTLPAREQADQKPLQVISLKELAPLLPAHPQGEPVLLYTRNAGEDRLGRMIQGADAEEKVRRLLDILGTHFIMQPGD